MTKKKYYLYAVPLIAVLLAAAGIILVSRPDRLAVAQTGTGEVLFSTPVKPGNVFMIGYTHSVNRGRVYDCYEVSQDGGFILRSSRFTSYGAGMPEPEDRQVFIVSDGYYELKEINRHMYELRLFVGVTAGHELIVSERSIYLDTLVPPKTAVTISIRK